MKVTNFQNYHQESRDLPIFGECLWYKGQNITKMPTTFDKISQI